MCHLNCHKGGCSRTVAVAVLSLELLPHKCSYDLRKNLGIISYQLELTAVSKWNECWSCLGYSVQSMAMQSNWWCSGMEVEPSIFINKETGLTLGGLVLNNGNEMPNSALYIRPRSDILCTIQASYLTGKLGSWCNFVNDRPFVLWEGTLPGRPWAWVKTSLVNGLDERKNEAVWNGKVAHLHLLLNVSWQEVHTRKAYHLYMYRASFFVAVFIFYEG